MAIENTVIPEVLNINENICVIGSGITGCTAAFLLRTEGYNVTLVEEREHLFSGTSVVIHKIMVVK